LIFAMADHGQLPAPLAAVHPRLHTPVLAIVITAVIALALAVSGSFIYIVKITLISRISVYAFTCVLLPIFRRRRDMPPATFKLPGGDAIGILCAIVCVLLLANSSMRELLDVGIAVAVGFTIYAATRRSQRTPAVA
jgi:amino acid transporter